MSAVKLNIEGIVEAAREAGADHATCQRFAAKLAELEECPEYLVDLDTTQARKVLSRHWGSVFELGGEETDAKARDEAIARTRWALWQSTDFATRIVMGQWRNVASDLRRYFQMTARPGRKLTSRQIAMNEQIGELAAYIELRLPDQYAERSAHFEDYYNAHRVACVLSCRHEECPLHFDCWETRGAFCAMDIEREAKDKSKK